MATEKEKVTVYTTPKKEIFSNLDMSKWINSEAYHEYVGFIVAMNEAVKGKKITEGHSTSQTIENMTALLEKMDKWIDEIPPIDQPQRFGNKAFRQFFQRLSEGAEDLFKEALTEDLYPSIVELSVYLVESVGNCTRIDYGTGHEMAFAMLLCCLFKIGALKEEDSAAAILKVFNRYLILMRKLQATYRMEPAGSHGVWSLDDFQFLPFIWGSAQLIDHPHLEPKSFPNKEIATSFRNEYMFMDCIHFINEVKTGPFAEHSNQLWNISGVASWSKVNSGLIKMYKVEVLKKFPVIQHTLFGSLFPISKHDPGRESGKNANSSKENLLENMKKNICAKENSGNTEKSDRAKEDLESKKKASKEDLVECVKKEDNAKDDKSQ